MSTVRASVIVLLAAAAIGGATMVYWSQSSHQPGDSAVTPDAVQQPPAGSDDPYAAPRRLMVEEQLRSRDIDDPRVLAVMGRVPRERFVPVDQQRRAYEDHPLPIGLGQTISQPYIVALMTQLAHTTAQSRVLEVGAGSGYQSAVLAESCKEVYGIEILKPLAEGARKRLAVLGYKNVSIRAGDGYRGWPEKAPFDIIIVAAAPDHVPQPLVEQLAPGGRLVIPVGNFAQELLVIEKQKDGTIRRESIAPVMFVPMRGEAEKAQGK